MARESHLLPPGPAASRAATIRHWLTGTFGGRAIVVGTLIKVVAFVLTLVVGSSAVLDALDTVGDLGLVIGVVTLGYRVFVNVKRALLWRVRRKLTLSYIFIGFVPALLIITFFLLLGMVLLNNLSSHLISSRIRELQTQAELLAQMAALNIEAAGSGANAAEMLALRQRVAQQKYPGVSYAVIPANNPCSRGQDRPGDRRDVIRAGPWTHQALPSGIPSWIACSGHAGLTFYEREPSQRGAQSPARLMVRAVAWPSTGQYAVLVDVPITSEMAHRLRDDTGITLTGIAEVRGRGSVPIEFPASPAASEGTPAQQGGLFQRPLDWVTFFQSTDWESGESRGLTVGIRTSVAELYRRITPEDIGADVGGSFGSVLLLLVAVVGVMFLVIQLVAFGMGLGLARSITGAVHELSEGTERVRRGDFSGQIAVRSRDQMGQLADSFNEMTASIEVLLQEKAEKERLEQELLIARRIQMSLLPQGPARIPGLTLTAHCEPAREVGGDYYDFLPIDEYTIGVLIADVSGKGTSAALYMAELKGIILSLSQRHTSPRELLIEADRIISRHLDSRSFITVSYLLVDLRSRTVRYARAGHCPLIYMPGPYASGRAPRLLTPDGLVLGLQLDEGRTFTRLLEEVTLPLGPGDLFVLYTDGMSEAMNAHGECFGESRLADVVGKHADLPADDLRDRILSDLDAFAGAAAQHDDMTMVLLRVDEMAAA